MIWVGDCDRMMIMIEVIKNHRKQKQIRLIYLPTSEVGTYLPIYLLQAIRHTYIMYTKTYLPRYEVI